MFDILYYYLILLNYLIFNIFIYKDNIFIRIEFDFKNIELN